MHIIGRTLARGSGLFAKLAGFALALAIAAPAKAQTPVVFGDTISSPGIYFLLGNQSGTGDGIIIESDDVALLLLRFTLRGDGTTGTGITSEGHDNVNIYGGRVTGFETGIEMNDGEDCLIRDIRVDHCDEAGVDVDNLDDSWFVRVHCDYNDENGFEAEGCDDNHFLSVLCNDNEWDGLHLGFDEDDGSDDNTVRLCWAAYNGRDGIRVLDSDDNTLKRNQAVGNDEVGIHLDGDIDKVASLGDDANGSDDNELESNWCVFNRNGIRIENGSTDNHLHNNTALANFIDMVDENPEPPCENTWFLNFFLFREGDGEDCIF